jgi:lysyl-tRNA synthetase class 2
MKRLLAEGFERIFQIARVFRNGELSPTHNPEFTLLEMYRAGADYQGIMRDVEAVVETCARSVAGGTRLVAAGRALDLAGSFERVTVADAFARYAGVDLAACHGDEAELRRALSSAGVDGIRATDAFDDLFFRAFLERIEPALAESGRPTFVVDWPRRWRRSLGCDAPIRAGPSSSSSAQEGRAREQVNELTDPDEQRRRLEGRAFRRPGRGLSGGRTIPWRAAAHARSGRGGDRPRSAAHAARRRRAHRGGAPLPGV